MICAEIIPNFFQMSAENLCPENINLFVDLRSGSTLIPALPGMYLHAPMPSDGAVSIVELDAVVSLVLNVLNNERRVVVCSANGTGRAALVSMALLVQLYGDTPATACDKVQKRVPTAKLTEPQQQSLLDYFEFVAKYRA